MSNLPLLVFDFDGVIIDGMEEYWWAARQASIRLIGPAAEAALPVELPALFRSSRPWVHHGWEMVLLAAELMDAESPLRRLGAPQDSADYLRRTERSLEARGWQPAVLQEALEQVRREAVAKDRTSWLALHRPFPGVVDRLRRFQSEGVAWSVLTTKGRAFAAELLDALDLQPVLLHGHEDGSKPEVLLQLRAVRRLRGFIEDRRATLEAVHRTPGLDDLPCYLVSWGYLKPQDRHGLPDGVHWLEPELFASPLASWP